MQKTYWKCVVCSAVFEGTMPPEICPVCKAGREAFIPYTPEEINFKNDTDEKILIIGSGAAATSAAESVRKRNATAKIDIFTSENKLPYFRPILIRALNENIKDKQYYLHPAPFYANRKIEIHTGKTASSIDPRERTANFADGGKYPFDKILLATGAKNFAPPIPGTDLPRVFTLREAADFDNLKTFLGTEKNIVIIGGGILGLEIAGILNEMRQKMTVVEVCPRILPRQTDPASSKILEKIITASGVNLVKGAIVSEIVGKDHVEGVRLNSGEMIKCDMVIISTGITSRMELAKFADIKCARGIVVNEFMQTSTESVFAAGDCAVFGDKIDGVWETAAGQGRVAGANIAGDKTSYKAKMFGTLLNAFGTKLFSTGDFGTIHSAEKYEVISTSDNASGTYKAFYFLGGKAVGGILLGDAMLTCPLIAAIENSWDIAECAKNGIKRK